MSRRLSEESRDILCNDFISCEPSLHGFCRQFKEIISRQRITEKRGRERPDEIEGNMREGGGRYDEFPPIYP